MLRSTLLIFVLLSSAVSEGQQTRPATPVRIPTMIYLVDIREIDGTRQLFAGDVFIRLRWKDPHLSGSQGTRTLPLNSAWSPNIQITNRVQAQTTLPEVLETDAEGNVIYRQRFIGQFSCLMDLAEFPFDRQRCSIDIVAIGSSPEEVQFVPDQTEGGMAERLSITDWKISSWTAKEMPYRIAPSGRSLARYRFEFTGDRHFLFFLVQIIVPMSLILGMSWIVFWLDPEQPGTRISISITSMLTIVAYRLLLGNFLPRLSFLTRMDFFIFGCTLLVFLTLMDVVLINGLFRNTKESAAMKLDHLSRWIFPVLYLVVLTGSFLV